MRESLTFYYCTICGAMSMKNFRDEFCRGCGVAMKVNFVEVHNVGGGGLEVIEGPAPHED
jgi:hypothetical protein